MSVFEAGPLKTNQWVVPTRTVFEGRFVRLEKLEPRHFQELYDNVVMVDDAVIRYRYLLSVPPRGDYEAYLKHMTNLLNNTVYMPYVLIEKQRNSVQGMQSFMYVNTVHGTMEIGSILWGPRISRTPVTTEAFYLFSCYAFDDLNYRRYEWKCNNDNVPSKKAAVRFGFQWEGLFRQHLIQNGYNRDTAYFSMLDSEWPLNKSALEAWLDPSNFLDVETTEESTDKVLLFGKQIRSLNEIRQQLLANN